MVGLSVVGRTYERYQAMLLITILIPAVMCAYGNYYSVERTNTRIDLMSETGERVTDVNSRSGSVTLSANPLIQSSNHHGVDSDGVVSMPETKAFVDAYFESVREPLQVTYRGR